MLFRGFEEPLMKVGTSVTSLLTLGIEDCGGCRRRTLPDTAEFSGSALKCLFRCCSSMMLLSSVIKQGAKSNHTKSYSVA